MYCEFQGVKFQNDIINWRFDFVEAEVMFIDLLYRSPPPLSLVKAAMGFHYLN